MAEKIVINSKDLKHSGILGQKWGNRRYQNEDGTYTEEGKERRRKGSSDYLRSRELKKKGIKNLSNQELKELNNRQEMERKYSQNNMNLGERFVSQYMGALIGTLTGLAVTATVAKGKTLVNKFKG